MNAIFSCCISDVWLETARLLKTNLNIECKYFIGWKDDLNEDKLREIDDCYLQFVEDAWRGLGFPSYVKTGHFVLDESIFSKYSFDIWIATKMIDRLDPTGEVFSFSERSYWIINLIEYWLQVIDKKNIELVVSPSIPHRVFDYALYIAAKMRRIKFIMFQMTPFGDKSFIIDDVNSTSKSMKKGILEYNDGKCLLPKDIEDRIKLLLGAYEDATPDYMVKQKKESTIYARFNNKIDKIKKVNRFFKKANTYRVIEKNDPHFSNITLGMLNVDLIKGELFKRKLKKKYYELVSICHPRREENDEYILVALHYQPEETSCPTGGVFTEQRQIVKLLVDVLPSNCKVYVKEHSSQFHPKMEGEAGRTISYYENLMDISKRVVLVKDTEDTFSLIDNALATVTVSGTIGWESVFRGTPALIFGRAWYEDMPGVFKIKDRTKLKNVFDNIKDGYLMPSTEELFFYHRALNKHLVSASHYKATASKNITGIEESALNISKSIEDYFRLEMLCNN